MEQKSAEREVRRIVREEATNYRKKEPAALEVQVQELRRKVSTLNFCVCCLSITSLLSSINFIQFRNRLNQAIVQLSEDFCQVIEILINQLG